MADVKPQVNYAGLLQPIKAGDTLGVANGGSGATTAAGARTNFGLAIGSDVQAWDADLDSLAALSGTNTIYYRSAANTWSAVTFSGLTFSGGVLTATGGGVTSFNTRTGAVTLTSGDVTGALTFTPLDAAASSFGGSALKWTTPRTLSITGDLAYTSPSFDGSGNVTAAGTLATVNTNVGSFTNANITVNAKGLITAAASGSGGSGTVTHTAGALTARQLVIGNGTDDIKVLGAATNGQIPIGSTGADPVLATITAGPGISVDNSVAGAITINNTGSPGTGAEVLISEVVTSGSAASVTFSSIAATWRDLRVVARPRSTAAVTLVSMLIQLNSDTAANYDHEYNQTSNLSSPQSTSQQGIAQTSAIVGSLPGSTAPSGVSGSVDLMLYDYRGTVFQKQGQFQSGARAANTSGNSFIQAGIFGWRSTAAVTAVKVFPSSGNFVDGSVISLYGRY